MMLNNKQKEVLNVWLGETGELYVDVFLPHSGGGGTGYLLRSIQDLESLIKRITWPIGTITIFRNLQYPLRGIANEELLEKALKTFPDSSIHVILIGDEGYFPSSCIYVGGGDSHQELIESYHEFEGQLVGIGQNPYDESDTIWMESSPDVMFIKVEQQKD